MLLETSSSAPASAPVLLIRQYDAPVKTLFSILNNGFVGIGTAQPAAVLHTVGSVAHMSGNVGIGTTSPGAILDVKGDMRLSGTTSGYVGFTSPAVGGAETYTLPIDPGTNGQVLTTNGTASTPTLSWTTPAGGAPLNTIPTYQVRVATTGNITLSGTQTIDAVAVVAEDRVLVKNQSTNGANGVYVVAAGSWTRAADINTWAQAIGYSVVVSEGAVWSGSSFSSAAVVGGTIDTTALKWYSRGEGAVTTP